MTIETETIYSENDGNYHETIEQLFWEGFTVNIYIRHRVTENTPDTYWEQGCYEYDEGVIYKIKLIGDDNDLYNLAMFPREKGLESILEQALPHAEMESGCDMEISL